MLFKKANPKPKVVIIDYRLPFMSGLEVMKEILAIEPRTKIVFISGDESVRQKSLDAGAKVFMKKPTGINDITAGPSCFLYLTPSDKIVTQIYQPKNRPYIR